MMGGERTPIALEDPAHGGLYGREGKHVWTNGHARISLPAHSGPALLVVSITGQAARWQAPVRRKILAVGAV